MERGIEREREREEGIKITVPTHRKVQAFQ
jgi:hypothetical protein